MSVSTSFVALYVALNVAFVAGGLVYQPGWTIKTYLGFAAFFGCLAWAVTR